MEDCIFCRIVKKQMPAEFLYEDEQIIAFKDIHPKASVHLLVVTKKHIKNLAEFSIEDAPLMTHILFMLPKLAKQQGLTEGFRTIINTGKGGGQEIDHIHFHLLGDHHKVNN